MSFVTYTSASTDKMREILMDLFDKLSKLSVTRICLSFFVVSGYISIPYYLHFCSLNPAAIKSSTHVFQMLNINPQTKSSIDTYVIFYDPTSTASNNVIYLHNDIDSSSNNYGLKNCSINYVVLRP